MPTATGPRPSCGEQARRGHRRRDRRGRSRRLDEQSDRQRAARRPRAHRPRRLRGRRRGRRPRRSRAAPRRRVDHAERAQLGDRGLIEAGFAQQAVGVLAHARRGARRQLDTRHADRVGDHARRPAIGVVVAEHAVALVHERVLERLCDVEHRRHRHLAGELLDPGRGRLLHQRVVEQPGHAIAVLEPRREARTARDRRSIPDGRARCASSGQNLALLHMMKSQPSCVR